MQSGWRRPYAVILACHAGVFLAFSAAFPFISLYVQQLGITDQKAAAGWAGAINGIATAMVSVMNPIWGTLADRWGVKAGLVRCLACCVAGLAICAAATQPEHLLAGRLVQAVGGGANAAAIIAVGSIVPTQQLGATMGLMQTAQSLSGALGPAIGGFVGDLVGFRYAFAGSAVLLVLVTLAVLVFVREPARDTSIERGKQPFFSGLAYVVQTPTLRALIVLFFLFHLAYQMVWTFLPLRVQELVTDPSLVGRWSGAAALGDALGIAAGASITGWFGTRLRAEPRVLVVVVCAVAAVATAAQVFIARPELFVALRVAIGVCYGGAVVLMRAALGAEAHPSRRGVTYGVGQSAFAGGFSAGALVGSAVAANSSIVTTFALSAIAFTLVAAWAAYTFPRQSTA